MYISDVDLASLGWPGTETEPIPSLTEPLIHKTPFIGFGVALGLVSLNWIIKRRNQLAESGETDDDRRTETLQKDEENHD
jgi:hypothetical protein